MTPSEIGRRTIYKLRLADEGCCVTYGEPLMLWCRQNKDRLIERTIYHDGVAQDRKAKLYKLPEGLVDLPGEWLMHSVTGSLYSPTNGVCLSTHRLRVEVP